MKYLIRAVRNPDMDYLGDERPYCVEFIFVDNDGYSLESVGDWEYYASEKKANKVVEQYNKTKVYQEIK